MAAPAPESLAHDTPNVNAPQSRDWGRGTFLLGSCVIGGVETYYAFNAQVRSPEHLYIGLLILFLAALPSLLWARRGRASLPVFEILMLTCANAYALPLLNGHSELIFYTPEDITTAGLAVLTYQISAIVVYQLVGGRASTHPFWRDDVINRDIGRWLTYGMIVNTVYLALAQFTQLLPTQFESVLRAIFFGIGIVCTFISSRRLGAGELTAVEKFFFFTNILAQCVIMTSTLYLVAGVSTLLLALTGYVSGSGKVPIVAAGCALFAVALLHNGKSEMRAKYWKEDHISPGIAELPAFYGEWLEYGMKFRDDADGGTKITSKLIDRTSLFHIMCLVVSTTPHQQPFMHGETYKDIPAQFVPRPFWPEKPLGHISTSKLAIYYGLQTEEDTEKTTIGFGMVTEAYANFGFIGVAMVAALLGFFFKKVQVWATDSPLFSYGGLIVVIMLAWSFQAEFTLSIWLASFYQACVGVVAIPFVLKNVFGK